MSFSLTRWRAKHLLLAWSAYWLALILVALSPAMVLALRAVSAPHGKGNISVGMANGAITATIAANGANWVGTASLMNVALWIAGPPLVLWLVWLVTRRSPAAREAERDHRVS